MSLHTPLGRALGLGPAGDGTAHWWQQRVTAVGLALKDGKIRSLHDPARKYHPTFGVPPKSNAASPCKIE